MAKKRREPMPKKHVALVQERSQGMCEAHCGKRASNIHHRRFLGRGGQHNVANLVALCGNGNIDGCHGRAHGAGQVPAPEGWAISAWEPRGECDVPFVDVYGQAWLFDDQGGKKEHDGNHE